jgi:hypothetical protein
MLYHWCHCSFCPNTFPLLIYSSLTYSLPRFKAIYSVKHFLNLFCKVALTSFCLTLHSLTITPIIFFMFKNCFIYLYFGDSLYIFVYISIFEIIHSQLCHCFWNIHTSQILDTLNPTVFCDRFKLSLSLVVLKNIVRLT